MRSDPIDFCQQIKSNDDHPSDQESSGNSILPELLLIRILDLAKDIATEGEKTCLQLKLGLQLHELKIQVMKQGESWSPYRKRLPRHCRWLSNSKRQSDLARVGKLISRHQSHLDMLGQHLSMAALEELSRPKWNRVQDLVLIETIRQIEAGHWKRYGQYARIQKLATKFSAMGGANVH